MKPKKIIFEDSALSPMSGMLKDIFESDKLCGECNIIFTHGNKRLRYWIDKFISCDMIIYVDCAPGNTSTIGLYRKLKYMYSGYKNISIVPIPCIEYYMICILIHLGSICGCVDYEIFLDCLRKNNNIHNRSFEKICKSVINHQQNCKQNKTKAGYTDVGKFWHTDCTCGDCNERHLFIRDKVNAFFEYFPICTINGQEYTPDINYVKDLYDRLEYHYPGILKQIMIQL